MSKLNDLIKECLGYEDELEWVEFKANIFNIDEVGEYISALSNSVAILGKPNAYMIWGIENDTHKVIGTNINYNKEINNEPIQHYLARKLSPSLAFYFDETKYEDI